MVKYIDTKEEFDDLIKKNSLVVVDFTASWCPPCQRIGPIFEKLSDKYQSIKFFKVDVDKNGEVAEQCGIEAMPTFVFFENGKEFQNRIRGANEQGLEETLKRLSGSTS